MHNAKRRGTQKGIPHKKNRSPAAFEGGLGEDKKGFEVRQKSTNWGGGKGGSSNSMPLKRGSPKKKKKRIKKKRNW